MKRTSTMQSDQAPQEHTIGCFEVVSFQDLGVENEWAKIDTGAYSGALHCTDIKVYRRGLMRRRVLKFTPLGNPELATETTKFICSEVTSSNGAASKRYLIDTQVQIGGQTYPIRIGIADRSGLKRNILIGRRFLRVNNFLVDVRINQEHDDDGGNS